MNIEEGRLNEEVLGYDNSGGIDHFGTGDVLDDTRGANKTSAANESGWIL